MKLSFKAVLALSLVASGFGASFAHQTYSGSTALASEQASEQSKEIFSGMVSGMVSDLSEQRLETSFQAILKDASPGERAKAHLTRVVRIYFRAQAYLKNFDQKLDLATAQGEALDLESQPEYRKLQASRMLLERERDRIAYMYKRLIEIKTDKASSSSDLAAANQMLEQMGRVLSESKNDVQRVALQDLVAELEPMTVKAKGIAKLPKLAFADAKEVKAFFNEKNKAEINKRAAKSEADASASEEIEAAAAETVKLTEETEREPQAAGIFATASGAGNVNGSNFSSWALTYDDGPHAKNTMAILKNLQTYKHEATFFWLASLAPKMPKIVAAVKAAGMDLANHSYSHKQLTKSSTNNALEIGQSTDILTKAYGQPVKLFRCPYGACGSNGSNVRSLIAKRGMIHVAWNVDSLDWQDKNSASVLARVKKQMATKKGGIILFHDIQTHTVEASRLLMAEFAAKGAKLNSVQSIIDKMNQ